MRRERGCDCFAGGETGIAAKIPACYYYTITERAACAQAVRNKEGSDLLEGWVSFLQNGSGNVLVLAICGALAVICLLAAWVVLLLSHKE